MWSATRKWKITQPEELSGEEILDLAGLGEKMGQPCRFVLEGQERENERSYLGFGEGWIISGAGRDSAPLQELRKALRWQRSWRDVDTEESRRLESGLVGYLDYEWGLVWQKPSATPAQPGFFFRACPVNLILLPAEKRLILEIIGRDGEKVKQERARWEQAIESRLTTYRREAGEPAETGMVLAAEPAGPGRVLEGEPAGPATVRAGEPEPSARLSGLSPAIPGKGASEEGRFAWQSNMPREYFLEQVKRIQEYIKAGDVFQAVFSQRFSRPAACSPWEIYRQLRLLNPSPYLYLLEGEGEYLVGSSPELLVSTTGNKVFTRPIAGTRPRGGNAGEDARMERELLADAKERAEHAMLVDLGRNDLGRVSVYGTVRVSQYAEVERFSHVMHLVSTVEGYLDEEHDGLAALQAVFPAGTLTGAPKVRAMEILQDLEPGVRGAYGGALGILRWNGDVDFCITIRTLQVGLEQVSVQAGAGIVLDSQAEREYEETIHKAQALMQVVNNIADGHR